MILRVLLFLLVACAPGCSAWRHTFGKSPEEARTLAEAGLERGQAALDAGHNEQALEELRRARALEPLPSELENRIDVQLEHCAELRIAELSKPGSDPSDMEELFDLNLPRQLAITAGVRTARLLLDDGEEVDAYQMIQKVDTRYPPAGTHHERTLAGDVLFEAGMKLSESNFSFLGLFSDRDDALAILEYLVQNYPQERRCDQAYRRLAKLYEQQRLWRTALEQYQSLVTYHIDSPLAPEAEWRIAHLRLVGLRRSDFDRRELLRALGELDAWLSAHKDHELEDKVRADRRDCARRLAESDLFVAHFYTEVEKWEGARFHAKRARVFAEQSGDADTIADAERAVARVPEPVAGAGLVP